jgi:hypothetical protein
MSKNVIFLIIKSENGSTEQIFTEGLVPVGGGGGGESIGG